MKPSASPLLRLIAWMFCLGFYHQLLADCAGRSITVWPMMGTILPNQQFVIQGYMGDQQLMRELATIHPAFLVRNHERIALHLIEVCEGEMHVTQAILRPQKLLQPGETYRLWIQGIHDNPAVDPGVKRDLDLMWRPVGFPDMTGPKWLGRPVFHTAYDEAYGCGNATGVEFAISTQDLRPCWVKTEVRSLKQTDWRTYYLPLTEGLVRIGHDMCGGAYRLEGEQEFEVKFTLVDQAGNITPLSGNPIRFTRPTDLK